MGKKHASQYANFGWLRNVHAANQANTPNNNFVLIT